MEDELRYGQFWGKDGPAKKAKLKRDIQKEKERIKNDPNKPSSKKISADLMETEDPVAASQLNGTAIIFTPEGETKQFKGHFRFDKATKTFKLIGKLKGGAVYEKTGLSIHEAADLLTQNLYKKDADASSISDFINDNHKEFRNDKFQDKFFEEGAGSNMSDKDKEILKQLVSTSNGGVWKKLENATITGLTEETVDSRFSNEREGYLGTMSGDLDHVIRVTGIINGVKYQTVKNKTYDTRGFW
jgi:hypothetical protein